MSKASSLAARADAGAEEGLVIDEDDTHVASLADHVIRIPAACALLAPVVATIPLQLLAYHVAEMRGNDVDQPRNLAKSVTVE